MEYAGSPFEIKQLNDSGHIEGLLAGFGDVDRGGDMLLAGCFTKSLAARTAPLPMLLHHDMRRPIGAWKEWSDRPEGLYVKGALTMATRDAQEAFALAKEGALTGLSIGWRPDRKSTDPRSGVRTVAQAELFEGSLVTVPMHDRTRVASVKSVAGPADIEEMLRECGISGRKAKAGASAAWKSITENDEDGEGLDALAALVTASTNRIARLG